MSIDQLINVFFTLVLAEMMVSIGLSVTLAELVAVVRRWPLVLGAVFGSYVIVPAAAVGLLLWFDARPLVAAGFLIAAVCPGAPFGPPFTAIAKGNVPVAVGLMVILAGSSVVGAPLLLHVLLRCVAAHAPLHVDVTKIVGDLLLAQLVPLCVGLAVRHWRPPLAIRLQGPASRVSAVGNVIGGGAIVATQYPLLTHFRLAGWLGMLALVLTALVTGWLLGGPVRGDRKAMTMTTSIRNVGLSMVIATGSFAGTAAVAAALAFAVIQTATMALVAVVWGRSALIGK